MVNAVDFPGTYVRRVIDDELDDLFAQLPALLLDGPKSVGKTATATQRCRSIHQLDVAAQREIVDADPAIVGRDPAPLLIDEWQRVPAVFDAVRRLVDNDPLEVASCSPVPRRPPRLTPGLDGSRPCACARSRCTSGSPPAGRVVSPTARWQRRSRGQKRAHPHRVRRRDRRRRPPRDASPQRPTTRPATRQLHRPDRRPRPPRGRLQRSPTGHRARLTTRLRSSNGHDDIVGQDPRRGNERSRRQTSQDDDPAIHRAAHRASGPRPRSCLDPIEQPSQLSHRGAQTSPRRPRAGGSAGQNQCLPTSDRGRSISCDPSGRDVSRRAVRISRRPLDSNLRAEL